MNLYTNKKNIEVNKEKPGTSKQPIKQIKKISSEEILVKTIEIYKTTCDSDLKFVSLDDASNFIEILNRLIKKYNGSFSLEDWISLKSDFDEYIKDLMIPVTANAPKEIDKYMYKMYLKAIKTYNENFEENLKKKKEDILSMCKAYRDSNNPTEILIAETIERTINQLFAKVCTNYGVIFTKTLLDIANSMNLTDEDIEWNSVLRFAYKENGSNYGLPNYRKRISEIVGEVGTIMYNIKIRNLNHNHNLSPVSKENIKQLCLQENL